MTNPEKIDDARTARLCLITLAALFSACGPARDDTTPVEEPPPEGVYGQAPAAVGGIHLPSCRCKRHS